jgi:hypothetical protein
MLAVSAAIGLSMVAGSQSVSAVGDIFFDGSPGTSAPPRDLGPYRMTPFADDTRAVFTDVTTVPAPGGRTLRFSEAHDLREIGSGWATWSHGYDGDVYISPGTESEIMMPSSVSAFYFYAEPNPFQPIAITAIADDGTSSGPIIVDGDAGARYFGFYGLDGKRIRSIIVESPENFAIGEFGISYEESVSSFFLQRQSGGGGAIIGGAIALAASQNQREAAAAARGAAPVASPPAVTAPRTGDLGPTGPVFIAPPATGNGGLVEASDSNATLMAGLALVLAAGMTLGLSLAHKPR